METRGLIRGLRGAGILALLAIAVVALAEAGLLVWRIAAAPARTQLVANGGSLYGVLALMDVEPRKRPFEQADFEFVEIMGTMVGTAISRAHRETALQEKAFHDPLTGVANRALLEEHLNSAIARAQRTGERLALYYLDLDAFKPINFIYGHAAGDGALCEIARRLSLAVRQYDLVARIGGDEFVVLQSAINDDTAVDAMMRRLRRVTDKPIELFEGDTACFALSLGVAVYPNDGRTASELMMAADVAMYRRKAAGKRAAISGIG
jgi:diguanylate cyclase (GGDEF)-like protein